GLLWGRRRKRSQHARPWITILGSQSIGTGRRWKRLRQAARLPRRSTRLYANAIHLVDSKSRPPENDRARRTDDADALNRMVKRLGNGSKRFGFPIHVHMIRHACGFKLANDGHDTRALQDYLGHKSISGIE